MMLLLSSKRETCRQLNEVGDEREGDKSFDLSLYS